MLEKEEFEENIENDTYKIEIPLATNEELERVMKSYDTIINKVIETTIHDKDMLYLQAIIKEQNERLKDYISRDKLKKIYGKLCMELGSYVRDKATPQQERIAGAMNLLNKILEGNYEIWKNKKILL